MNAAQYDVKVTLEAIIETPQFARRLWVALLCVTFEQSDALGALGLELRAHAKDALACSVDSMLVEIARRARTDLF